MSVVLSRATFEGLAEKGFVIPVEDGDDFRIELLRIDASETLNTPDREQFSLVFRGPSDRMLNQGTFMLNHEELGTVPLFLVPVSQGDEGFEYEAVFYRLLNKDA